jgi:hypothetical protein
MIAILFVLFDLRNRNANWKVNGLQFVQVSGDTLAREMRRRVLGVLTT